MNRRSFIKIAGATLALIIGLFSFGKIGPHLRKLKYFFEAVPPIEIGEGADEKIDLFTPNERFFVQDAFSTPNVDIDKWSLSVEGMVRRPLNLTYEEITSMSSTSIGSVLECISNPIGGNQVGNALWTGVPLRDILDLAEVETSVKKIVFYTEEGYSDSIPLEKALSEEVILAFSMNEETLSREHGYPLRAVVPGIHGMKWAKWLTRIEAVDLDYKGYWEKDGWSDEARVDIATKIIKPKKGERISGGTYSIYVLAWEGGGLGIEKVEVSMDGGRTWHLAKIIKAPESLFSWTLWKHEWEIDGKGDYKIIARAVDKAGNVQVQGTSNPYPNGASRMHEIGVKAI